MSEQLCACGCGQPTTISDRNHTKYGWIKGQPKRFVHGHATRKYPHEYVVNPETGCWEWMGSRNEANYGHYKDGLAHRIFYEEAHGPIPDGLYVCHDCDNPPCVNPNHMFLGTQTDNMGDSVRKGRFPKGSAHGASKLTEDEVREIRRLAHEGRTQKSIATHFRMAQASVSRIVNRVDWKHVLVALLVIAASSMVSTSQANAYVITGPDNDGRHATIANVLRLHPGVRNALPATVEYRVASWSLNNSAKTTVQADGHIRVDISGTLMNPQFSALVAHETAHVLELSHSGWMASWKDVERAHGFPDSMWRYYPQTDWWHYSVSESMAENFTRALFYPYYSPWSTPRTYLVWLSRVEMWSFLNGREVMGP